MANDRDTTHLHSTERKAIHLKTTRIFTIPLQIQEAISLSFTQNRHNNAGKLFFEVTDSVREAVREACVMCRVQQMDASKQKSDGEGSRQHAKESTCVLLPMSELISFTANLSTRSRRLPRRTPTSSGGYKLVPVKVRRNSISALGKV